MSIALAHRPKFKLRVEDFDFLAENGALAELERTELVDGDIYLMNAQYSRHGNAKAHFHEALLDWKRIHRPELVVRSEMSVAMPPHDEPMPDVILSERPLGPKGIPVKSVFLLVEVSDDTLSHDLGYKASLYARQGVPEYWVVDLVNRKVHRHAEPDAEGYGQIDPFAFGDAVAAVTLAGLVVETRELVD